MIRWVALAVAVGAAGCGEASSGDAPPVDSTLVELLADLHLADARATLDSTGTRGWLADSLRQSALRAHGTDSAALAERLERMTDDPERVRATYDALDTRLNLEQQGIEPAPSRTTRP